MTRRWTVVATMIVALTLAGAVLAQQAGTPPAETPATPATGQPAPQSPELDAMLEPTFDIDSYTYDPQGRRDPFRSLIGRTRTAGDGTGISTYLIEEIDVQGVVRTRDGYIAMVTGPENQGYSLRVGDKVFDGEVVRITPTSVVFRQETREVVRELTQRGAGQN